MALLRAYLWQGVGALWGVRDQAKFVHVRSKHLTHEPSLWLSLGLGLGLCLAVLMDYSRWVCPNTREPELKLLPDLDRKTGEIHKGSK